MANHPSALKRYRQSERRRARNSKRLTRMRTEEKKLRAALEQKNQAAAQEQLSRTVAAVARAGSHGVLHRRTVARKISRLSRAAHRALAAKK